MPCTAQEQAQAGPQYPLLYTVIDEVDSDKVLDYLTLAGKIAEAHRKHEEGLSWITYTALVGGPNLKFYLFFPMEKWGDVDGWATANSVLDDVLGEEERRNIGRTRNDVADRTRMIIRYQAATSNWNSEWESAEPPPYGLFIHMKIKRGRVKDCGPLLREIAAASRSHPDGLHYSTWWNIVGGKNAERFIFAPMDTLAEMEGRKKLPEILAAAHGAEKAAEMVRGLGDSANSESTILVYRPELSNIPESQ
jgi:hypothetical protein